MTKPKAWKTRRARERDAEQQERLHASRRRDREKRLLMRRHALADGIDPFSLEATSPVTARWLKS